MADMQAGIGPFLGVFLLAHGWQSGLIGSVMTIGGVAGMVMSPAIGGWIAQEIGYSAMFMILGSFALGSVALGLGLALILKPASAAEPNEGASALPPPGAVA